MKKKIKNKIILHRARWQRSIDEKKNRDLSATSNDIFKRKYKIKSKSFHVFLCAELEWIY